MADAEDRRAAAGVPSGPGVTPDAAKDAEWRRNVAGSPLPAGEASSTTDEWRREVAGATTGPGVTPNVDKDAEWRRQVAGGVTPRGDTGTGFQPYFAFNSNVVIQA
jgi:hypothetical protein